mmetsp:Transcript_23582/g.56459  ORF Transcript_23582/g.56459 Transcript_23582/m.56459 type:complete len:220 (-) Transcript_23582:325-984(-)
MSLNLCSPLVLWRITRSRTPHSRPPSPLRLPFRRGLSRSITRRTSVTETPSLMSCASITSSVHAQPPEHTTSARPICSYERRKPTHSAACRSPLSPPSSKASEMEAPAVVATYPSFWGPRPSSVSSKPLRAVTWADSCGPRAHTLEPCSWPPGSSGGGSEARAAVTIAADAAALPPVPALAPAPPPGVGLRETCQLVPPSCGIDETLPPARLSARHSSL